MVSKKYIADYDIGGWIDSNNGRVYVPPPLVYGTAPTWELTFKSGGVAVDLSSAVSWKAAVDYEFDHATDPMLRVLTADIDATDADDGILRVLLDTRTQVFSDAIGTAKSLPAYLEILGLDADGLPIHSILLDITARNAVDPVGGTPPAVVPGNYSTTGGSVTPDPTAESKEYYFDVDREKWTDANGGVTAQPLIQYGTASQWKIHVISLASGTVEHVDLTACTAFQISAHNAFKAASPSIRTVNDSIDSSDKANGIIYAILDARNTVFSGVVGTSKTVAAYWEFLGFDNSSVPIVSSMLDVTFKNSVDPVGGTPPAPTGNYFTKTESDARYTKKIGADDIEITDASKGVIMVFGTQRIRARIDYADSIPAWVFDVL